MKNTKEKAIDDLDARKRLASRSMKSIIDAANQGKLVAVVGTGVSRALTNGAIPSWNSLIRKGFEFSRRKGRITDSQLVAWESQLSSSDMDELLSAAEFVGRKLGAPGDPIYGRWLQEEFDTVQPANEEMSAALRALVAFGIPICTLNYDHLLEDVTGLPTLLVSDTQKVISWMRREYPAILHLHGSWENPDSCILGIRDYESTQTNEVRDLFQRNLAAFNHLIFLGCGETLADPNFSALINWLRQRLSSSAPNHVALVRDDDLEKRNADPAWMGFVEPVSFGASHEDLPAFLLQNFSKTPGKKIPIKRAAIRINPQSILQEYRSFLLRDCGQMTIEGVSADMDTGQRKFDLERLFVPLNVVACPPDFPPNDPESVAKLEEWEEKNGKVSSFGAALLNNKRLALLALPGGGKTLLLKRLTVAYADPSRRLASSDELPDLELLPVLIRCREWRDHIKLPIKTLLKNIGDITGQPSLAGLCDALIPLLKKGQVLLLVDGLDEIHNDADRSTFVEHLESFLEEYKQTRIVVTSREAGFNLVAPSISRFCERWRIAPLSEEAIALLCGHWHRLMAGDTLAAAAESEEVAQTLQKKSSLRRLAENPLLLTMLLVVKHGAGGLPPDRVSLYGRAVDVLLDTWNIKGHEPLNPKEAVPQLAYVAFQMMCEGKQTATENELLILLEQAREKHPNIKRYAKDSPHDFLKRVELRSSLLLEAGHQMEGGRTVPFYQFRHLTFQEYLTAVAATEGHYEKYGQNDTVLTPLSKYLLSDEWKEVIPMVAVLARKRAEPLLAELIKRGKSLQRKMESLPLIGEKKFSNSSEKISGPAGRLLQCFIEEAEASPATISSALRLIAFFARGCRSSDDWQIICRGPYGEELYRQSWELLRSKKWPPNFWLMNTCAAIAEHQMPSVFWRSAEGIDRISDNLNSLDHDIVGRGLLTCMGILWNTSEIESNDAAGLMPIPLIERHLFNPEYNLSSISIWVWTNTRRRLKNEDPVSLDLLNLLSGYWLEDDENYRGALAAFALSSLLGMKRNSWTSLISNEQALKIRNRLLKEDEPVDTYERYQIGASFFIAYHSTGFFSDQELLKYIGKLKELNSRMQRKINIEAMRKSLAKGELDSAQANI